MKQPKKTWKNTADPPKSKAQLEAEWETYAVDLTTIINFGKHSGYSIEQIARMDFDWILWAFRKKVIILDKSDPGLYSFCRKYLEKLHTDWKNNKINK